MNTTRSLLALLLGVTLFANACKQDDPVTPHDEELNQLLEASSPGNQGKAYFLMPESNDYSRIPQDPKNPITAYKVSLGKMLFHETAIGSDPKHPEGKGTYSCASCHHAEAGFQAGIAQGLGDGGTGFGTAGEGRVKNTLYLDSEVDVQPIRTPSAMNGAYQQVQLWNGQFGATGLNQGTESNWTVGTPKEKNVLGFEGLETQAIAGQGVHRLVINKDWVKSNQAYKFLFDLAFPDVPESERYNAVNGGLAIAAYERTIFANQAPWQKWLKGDSDAMTTQEKEGAALFFGKAECGTCHTGPALNSMAFYCIGLDDLKNGTYGAVNVNVADVTHKGRGGFTGNDNELFQFKVPQLYNLVDAKFYGHGSSLTSVREMIEYKNRALPQNSSVAANRMAKEFHALNLSTEEIDALTVFLEKSLYDPNLKRYVPQSLPSGFCFPNNDTQSRIDRGCQ